MSMLHTHNINHEINRPFDYILYNPLALSNEKGTDHFSSIYLVINMTPKHTSSERTKGIGKN